MLPEIFAPFLLIPFLGHQCSVHFKYRNVFFLGVNRLEDVFFYNRSVKVHRIQKEKLNVIVVLVNGLNKWSSYWQIASTIQIHLLWLIHIHANPGTQCYVWPFSDCKNNTYSFCYNLMPRIFCVHICSQRSISWDDFLIQTLWSSWDIV